MDAATALTVDEIAALFGIPVTGARTACSQGCSAGIFFNSRPRKTLAVLAR
jgi:hypothetical protein